MKGTLTCEIEKAHRNHFRQCSAQTMLRKAMTKHDSISTREIKEIRQMSHRPIRTGMMPLALIPALRNILLSLPQPAVNPQRILLNRYHPMIPETLRIQFPALPFAPASFFIASMSLSLSILRVLATSNSSGVFGPPFAFVSSVPDILTISLLEDCTIPFLV